MLHRGRSKSIPARAAVSQTLWALNGLPEDGARDLEQWLDTLRELPLEEWIRIGERCASGDHGSLAAMRACTRLETAIAERELYVTGWLVRDLVETATYHVRREIRHQPRRVRQQLVAARRAAEWAALAMACGPWLQPADHNLLRAPFAPSRARDSATA